MSNGLTISWDGRLLLYVDEGAHAGDVWNDNFPPGTAPPGAVAEGYVFTTFDKSLVVDVGGKPDFSNCFGESPLARFANLSRNSQQAAGDPTVDYPEVGNGYPATPFTMGELGLLMSEFLSSNMYPAETTAPGGQNPFPGDTNGAYAEQGAYRIYEAWVLMQDITKFWHPTYGWGQYGATGSNQYFQKYETGVYPNGESGQSNLTSKRNGLCKLRIVVLKGTGGGKDEVERVDIMDQWSPFTVSGGDLNFTTVSAPPTPGISIPTANTMYADNFEPNLTFDGHLMVGKGSPLLCKQDGASRVCFYYNPVAFATDGWRGPWDLTQLYAKRNVMLDGRTIAERYPIARHPVKDYDGTLLTDFAFEGGYTWFSPDGRYVVYTCNTAGVGTGHPETSLAADGGGSSNRAHVSLFGSVTGWQLWRIDHAAVNPTRHMFTAWDQDSRTTHQRVSSFGFSPGFWDMLRGADALPMRDDGAVKLQLVNNQQLRYFELDLAPYQERDYGFYLSMSVMLKLNNPGTSNSRRVDLTRTPDLSGNGNFGTLAGAELPCEYFDLPSFTSASQVTGLYSSTATPTGPGLPADIHAGWNYSHTFPGPPDPGEDPAPQWALLADWEDGKDTDGDGAPDTTPFDGRGGKFDMDSDYAWGRVGQAMFFKQQTSVSVINGGAANPELNPGTTAPNATDELTASLWVRPLQGRSGVATLFSHHVSLVLESDGAITATVIDDGLVSHSFSSAAGAAPDLAWTHVALTWRVTGVSLSEARLYVDGVEAATLLAQPFDRLKLSSSPILVGCLENNAGVDPAQAVLLLDEVALKQSALVAKDVANLALLPVVAPTWTPQGFPAGPSPFTAADERVPTGHTYDSSVANIGADLFRDVQLSSNGMVSCTTCHDPQSAFTDGLTVAMGLTGPLLRNTPTLYNTRYAVHQFWDARAVDLEDQALDPVFTLAEMGFTQWSDVSNYFQTDPGYQQRFGNWLGISNPTVTEEHVREALSTYMRTLTAGNSPVDQGTLTSVEENGKQLFFGKARCSGCHNGPGFTDGRLWTTGTFTQDQADDGAANEHPDLIAAGTAGRARFLGAFKTPTLRELGRTEPFFHDGSAADLRAVVEFYNDGGVRADAGTSTGGFNLLDDGHDFVAEETNRKLGLTSGEMDDLVAYLNALTADVTGSVDDGPAGWNKQPTIAMAPALIGLSFGGGVVMSTFSLDVKDDDGRADFDPNMNETLEIEAGANTYHWRDSTLTNIRDGYKVRLVIPGVIPAGTRARVADHHGLWSNWISVN